MARILWYVKIVDLSYCLLDFIPFVRILFCLIVFGTVFFAAFSIKYNSMEFCVQFLQQMVQNLRHFSLPLRRLLLIFHPCAFTFTTAKNRNIYTHTYINVMVVRILRFGCSSSNSLLCSASESKGDNFCLWQQKY